MNRLYRIGQIVPSSNVTMETEVPFMLSERQQIRPERFTFHSSRMRMKHVRKEELASMDAESDRCAAELSDAAVDVLGYACLVAIMAMGRGYHRQSEARLHRRTAENGHPAPVVTSAGALVEGLRAIGARRITLAAPYMKPLTSIVIDYLENEGFTIVDSASLEIADNLEVARHDCEHLPEIVQSLNTRDADAIVVSACVQMPSLAIVPKLEKLTSKPVISAAIATTYSLLKALQLEPIVPNSGALLSGVY